MTESKKGSELTQEEREELEKAKEGLQEEDDLGAADADADILLEEAEASAREEVRENALRPSSAVPEWVVFPEKFKAPKGRELIFVRFRAAWTDFPELGDRHCIIWTLSDADEKIATARMGTNFHPMLTVAEYAKQMIRTVDGKRVDSVNRALPHNIHTFWTQIGKKCRGRLTDIYTRTHNLSMEEAVDFFANCVGVRAPDAG